MYIYKTHVSKASFTLTQLSTQHLFLENSSKAVNSPIVLLLLCITTRQLSLKKIQWISNLFPAKIFCGEKDLDTLVSLGMIKNKLQVRNPKTFNDQIQGQFTRYSDLNIVKKLLHSYIYTGIYLFCSESLMQKVIWVRKNFLTSSLAQLDYIPQILTLLQYKCFKGSGPLVAHSKSHKVFPIKKMLIIWYILGTTCSMCIKIWFI